MNIGELFVNLGIKGGKDTQNTLKGVKGGMKDIKSVSIEAKAAIVATIYTLKNLMQQSTQNGVALTQFSNLTGQSTKKLQQWQYANKMAGGTAEEVTGVVTSMQQAFAQLELGEGPAKYLGLLAEGLGKVGESLDVEKMNDSFYTLEKFRSFLKSGGTGKIGVDNEIGTSLGITPGMIAGIRGGMFGDKILNSANPYSEGQAKALQNVHAEWVKLADDIQKTIGRLNVKFGKDLVKDIGGLIKPLSHLVEQLILLSDKVGVFERLGKVFENIGNIAEIVTDKVRLLNEGPNKDEEGQNKMGINTMIKSGQLANGGQALSFLDVLGVMLKDKYGWLFQDASGMNVSQGAYSQAAKPNMGMGFQAAPNVTVNNNNSFPPSANPAQITEKVSTGTVKGVKEAYRQLPQGL